MLCLLLKLILLQKPEKLILEVISSQLVCLYILMCLNLAENNPLLKLRHPIPFDIRFIQPVGSHHLSGSDMPLAEDNGLHFMMDFLL